MNKIQSMMEGVIFSSREIDEVVKNCEICLKAKQSRNSFGDERTRSSKPLEIIHSDVCGPISPKTWDNKNDIVAFQDDCTGFILVYPMTRKSEVFDYLKEYAAEVETKWETKFKMLRSDNGGEYSSNEFD